MKWTFTGAMMLTTGLLLMLSGILVVLPQRGADAAPPIIVGGWVLVNGLALLIMSRRDDGGYARP